MALKPQKNPARLAWLPLVLALLTVVLDLVLNVLNARMLMGMPPAKFLHSFVRGSGYVAFILALIIPVALMVVAKLKGRTVAKVLLAVTALVLVIQLGGAVVNYLSVRNGFRAPSFVKFLGSSTLVVYLEQAIHTLRIISRGGMKTPYVFRLLLPLTDILYLVKNVLAIVFFAKVAKAPKA